MTGRWLLGIFTAGVVALILLNPFSALPLHRVISGYHSEADQNRLAVENAALRARVAVLEDSASVPPITSGDAIAASVYVRYPFNFKGEIMIDKGSADGISPGMPAVLGAIDSGRLALVGRVFEVKEHWATIQTLHDTRFQMGARIGSRGIEALVAGGNQPRLTFIEKNAEVSPGDAVYAAAAGTPYGLAFGEVREVVLASGGLLQETLLRLPYDLGQVRKLFILRQ